MSQKPTNMSNRLATIAANDALYRDFSDGYGGYGCMVAVANVLQLVDNSIPEFTHTDPFISWVERGEGSQKFTLTKTTIGEGAHLIKPGDVVILGNNDNTHATIAGELPDYFGSNRNARTICLYGNTGGKYNSGVEFVPSEGVKRLVKGSHWRLQEVTTEQENKLNDGNKIIHHGSISSPTHHRYKRNERLIIIRPK
ncbi:MAG: hypothetical protein SAK29_15430 [Scytonema sp. PMC 1069.18]|nr:hypothetical protein [Scytonema sp. PMC 1069.18]MEC4886529.1 hypothetical protein [Scytonema sp. PMC 1070.18]